MNRRATFNQLISQFSDFYKLDGQAMVDLLRKETNLSDAAIAREIGISKQAFDKKYEKTAVKK